jgi:hypothetical protein
VLRQDKEFGLVVVDLAKDPLAAGPLARSTTRNSSLHKALVFETPHIHRPAASAQSRCRQANVSENHDRNSFGDAELLHEV